MRCHMSCLVDNTGVSNLFKHIVSIKSLRKIHLAMLILSFLHIHSCTMENNPLLVDVCLVVELISSLTPSHSRCLYIQTRVYSIRYSFSYFYYDHISFGLYCALFLSFLILVSFFPKENSWRITMKVLLDLVTMQFFI